MSCASQGSTPFLNVFPYCSLCDKIAGSGWIAYPERPKSQQTQAIKIRGVVRVERIARPDKISQTGTLLRQPEDERAASVSPSVRDSGVRAGESRGR